ncbi:rhodanese-like domain-containing protein [Bacteroidota bacterium]
MDAEMALKQNIGTLVDVRSHQEYIGGNVSGSVNIPVTELTQRIEELKSLEQPLVFCCASGMRSSRATQILASIGFECFDAGSWLNANYYQSKS